MATYNDDGTNDYVPGESNARAVAAPPPNGKHAPAAAAHDAHDEKTAHDKHNKHKDS
jgi:hypothetical protein